MEEYLLLKVNGAAGLALRQSKLFSSFAMATPGMRELLCMGKLWELAQLERRTRDAAPYGLVIVDAPASGHGAAILRTPRTFAELARVGPIANQAQAIARTIADPAFTSVVAVSTPEEMPVNETFELGDALAAAPDPHELEAVILNRRHADRFTEIEVAALKHHGGDPGVRVALAEHARATRELEQERRLRDAFGERLLILPDLFVPRLELAQLGCWLGISRDERGATAGGQARLHLRRRGRCRQDDHRASVAVAWRRAGSGRGRHDRPGRRLANALGLERLENEPRLVSPKRLHGLEMRGELWAMMLDSKRTFDDLIERVARRRARRGDQAQRGLPRALERRLRFTGVHSDREALRARLRRLRPAGARHAAGAQRRRVPERARPADGVPRRGALQVFLRPTASACACSGWAPRPCSAR